MRVQIRTLEHKACNLPVIKPDIFKVVAHADKKGTTEDVCGLKTGFHFRSPPFNVYCISVGDTVEKESGS
jgi:hypothetical protein